MSHVPAESCPHRGIPKLPLNSCRRCQDDRLTPAEIITQKEAYLRKILGQLEDGRKLTEHLKRKVLVLEYEHRELLVKHSQKFSKLHEKIKEASNAIH